MSVHHRIAVACGLVLAAASALAGASSTAHAASTASTCNFREAGTSATVVIACPQGGAGAGYITTSTGTAQTPAAVGVQPDATPSDSLCTSLDPNYYHGWYGITPGSTADGGLSGLWLDANSGDPYVAVMPGNGSTQQQWCEEYAGNGAFYFYVQAGTYRWCLDLSGFANGSVVMPVTCAGEPGGDNPQYQLWYVCPRSGNSISLEPAYTKLSSEWLDVWGGSSNNGKSAFAPGHMLQIWTGNGQDNQRFTLYMSPGEPSRVYTATGGVAGC